MPRTAKKKAGKESGRGKVAIIIPSHNEQDRIGKTLKEYSLYFENLRKEGKLDYDILVVVNASKDRTLDITKAESEKNSRISYLDLEKGGKGYAVIEGFKSAFRKKYGLIGFVDADMATPPEAFYDLIKSIGNYDGVIASRWMKGSNIKTPQSFLRKIMSWGFVSLVKAILFLNYHDTQCGAKIFGADALKEVVPKMGLSQWAFDIEILYNMKKMGFKVIEIPTTWEDRKGSKLHLIKVPFQMFSSIIRIRLINSPLRIIVKAYDSLPEALKMHHLT